MKKIPLKAVPSQRFNVVLDGQNCTINIYYRFGYMYLDLVCNQTVIQTGAICRNRASVIQVSNNAFSGSLHFLDLIGDTDPYYKMFNDRYILLFVGKNETLPEGLKY